jgi:hypothetical protein
MFRMTFQEYLNSHCSIADPQLGAEAPLKHLADRVYRSLTGRELQKANTPGGDASKFDSQPLVVGLYGEWGCGKTFWLESIRKQILLAQHGKDGSVASTDPLIIPVFFNAWRFEKEPHLIVPLLKLTALELEAWSEYQATLGADLKKWCKNVLVSAAAFVHSVDATVKVEIVPKVLTVDIKKDQARADAVKKKYRDKLETIAEASAAIESEYFKLHTLMQQIVTTNVQGRSIRLLYLIDDLDRCLPEKAVEMLESIKLFLEVPGTAYVLAVDDEVVERGIQHRYRDYSFNSYKQTANGQATGEDHLRTPISCHEYLEKIITLPVRLDRPLDAEVSAFILKRCTALNALKDRLEARAQPIAVARRDGEAGAEKLKESQQATVETFGQLLRSIPKVPRKLLRLSELYGLRKDILNPPDQHEALLLRIVAVQLLAPEVYRLVTKGGDYEFLAILQEWRTGLGANLWPSFDNLQGELAKAYTGNPADRNRWNRFYQPLLQALHRNSLHRSGFRLEELITEAVVTDKSLDWRSLFHQLPPVPPPVDPTQAQPVQTAVAPSQLTVSVQPGTYKITGFDAAHFFYAASNLADLHHPQRRRGGFF